MASFARKQRTRLLVSYVTAVLSHGLLAIQQLRDKNRVTSSRSLVLVFADVPVGNRQNLFVYACPAFDRCITS